MRRMCISVVALWLCLASAVAQLNPSALLLTHPDAKALIGIDIRSLRKSSVAQAFGGDLKQTGFGMFHFPGVELLDDVDQVLVSSPGAKEGKKENPPFLLIATGHFAPEHLRPLLQGEHQTYHDTEIYTFSDNMDLALLDENTIILGDVPSLKGALDRRGAKDPSTLVTRGAAMSSSYDAWLIATISPSAFQPAEVGLAKLFQDIGGIDAGVSLRDGLDLDIGLLTSTPKAAQEIEKLLSDGLQAALTSKLDEKQAIEVARNLQVSADGNKMHLLFKLSKEELETQIQMARQARATTNSRIAVPADPGPKKIRIFGLDDGVHEIPFPPR
jgi:hypothetical protein